MGVLEGGDGPGLRPEPHGVALGPGLLGRGEATPVAEEEFREAMPGTQHVGADIFAAPQQIAGGFFLLGRNVNGGERAGATEHGELTRIAAVGFERSPARRGIKAGAMMSHGTPRAVSARCNSKPQGPAS